MQQHLNPRACAVVGLGGVGLSFIATAQAHPRWRVARYADLRPEALAAAAALAPQAKASSLEAILADPAIAMVALTTRADARPALIRRCLAAGKHIIAEKPLSCDPAEDDTLVAAIAASGLQVAVNLSNRHAWYHDLALAAIAAGEIGALATVAVSHQSQGQLPDAERPKPEGPPFRNCGMHYVDVLRWYAGEVESWHAVGRRMWGHPEPWWVTVNGYCAGGTAFNLTEGFTWAQGCPERTNRSHVEVQGSRGAIVVSHDFRRAVVEVHGAHGTRRTEGSYGGKHLPELFDRFARSLDAGRNVGYASAADCARASRLAAEMEHAVAGNAVGCAGDASELAALRACKAQRDSAT